MKLFIAIIAGSALATNVFAQYVTFGTSGTTRPIKYSTDDTIFTKVPTGNPANVPGYGELNVGFFIAPANTTLSYDSLGLPDFSSWTPVGTVLHTIAPTPGSMALVNLTLPFGIPGNDVSFEVVGWTGSETSWAQAVQDGTGLLGWAGSIESGGALGWQQPVGSNVAPAATVTGADGFNGLAIIPIIPEPSTFTLVALGATGFAFLRKKKASRVQD